MLPKGYFNKNFNNIEKIDNTESLDLEYIRKILPDWNWNFDFLFNADYFSYSNNWEFEELMKDFFEKSIYASDTKVYVGKLVSSYPNCYTVKDDEIEGCLICITSGLTENSYVLSKYYALLYLINKEKYIEGDLVKYKTILKNDIVRRIKEGYGGQIDPGNILYYTEIVMGDLNRECLMLASRFSSTMDLFSILHEYSHYLLNTFMQSGNIEMKAFIIEVFDIYTHLCESNPVYYNLPKEEVLADISALFLITNSCEVDIDDIMVILLSVVQLNKMSSGDTYTNNFRMEVFYYFFSKYGDTFSQYQTEIEKRVSSISELFDCADDSTIMKSQLLMESYKLLSELLLARSDKETAEIILNEQLKFLERNIRNLDYEENSDEFEEF